VPCTERCIRSVLLTSLMISGLLLIVGCSATAPVVRQSIEGAYNPFDDQLRTGKHRTFFLSDPQFGEAHDKETGYTIHYTVWRPEQPNGHVIVYNHGLQSHRGWFFATAEKLQREGFAVYAFDRIGAGESDGGLASRNGGLEHMRGHVPNWRRFVDTLEAMVGIASKENPGRDIVLWGNSYGAKIVTVYLQLFADSLEEDRIRKAVFTVPGLFLNEASMPLPFSRLGLLFSGNLSYFPVPMVARNDDNGAAWFVGPGPWFDRIRNDELSLRYVTRRRYLQTRLMDRAATGRPVTPSLPVPDFYLLVRDDPMMDNDKVEQFLEVRATDSLVKYYDGGPHNKHFLLFTADADQALADIVAYLDDRRDEIADTRHFGNTHQPEQ